MGSRSSSYPTDYSCAELYEEFGAPGNVIRQIMVPQPLRTEVMRLSYEGLLAGHLAVDKTFDRVVPHFYWPALRADIKRYCQSCDSCQRCIPMGKVRRVPLGDPEIPTLPVR